MIDKILKDLKSLIKIRDKSRFMKQNVPYLGFFYLGDIFASHIRAYQGGDVIDKIFQGILEIGTMSFIPSINLIDILYGVGFAGLIKFIVYTKGKNSKKFRQGKEYGSARWGTYKDIEPYVDDNLKNNILFTQTEKLTMNSRPANPKYARNKNVLVIGGSGSGKTRFFVKPNLMQMHSSYVLTDPKGTIVLEGRLSRNTTDCLELVRQLLKYDVYIQFEKENIHTGSMESEFMLAILVGMAKDESVSISENEKWGIRRRFMNGTFIIAYPPYGYANVDGEMLVIPEQAEVVRKIFTETLDGRSTHYIAQKLNKQGIPSRKGGKWTPSTIKGIINNEKYTGDVLFQKTFTDENFNRHTNKGDCDQFFCENHHEAIVSHETFDKANEVLKQRAFEKGNGGDTSKYQNRYGFSGRIICGECGTTFKRRTITVVGGYYIAWCCSKHIEDKESCSMKDIKDDDLKRAFLTMMNKLRFGNDLVLKPLLISICTSNMKKNEYDIEEIEKAMAENEEQRKQMNALLTKGYLEQSVFFNAHNKLVTEYEELISKRDMILRMDESGYTVESSIKELVDYLGKADIFAEFEDEVFERYIEKVIVKSREEVVFEFKFGLKLTERLG